MRIVPESPSFSYDVFLSHNWRDKPRVRRLAERLRDAGLRVFFDEWVIKPGDDIYLAIEGGLGEARVQSIVSVAGRAGIGMGGAGAEYGAFPRSDQCRPPLYVVAVGQQAEERARGKRTGMRRRRGRRRRPVNSRKPRCRCRCAAGASQIAVSSQCTTWRLPTHVACFRFDDSSGIRKWSPDSGASPP
jgi:TIR domain